MQEVVIIPKAEFDGLVASVGALSKRVSQLEKGLAEYVGTADACRLTGLHRDTLYGLRQQGKVEYKYEGKKVLYLRSSLEAYNTACTPRRKRNANLKAA